ncbi:MAG: DUF1634 domain-containing protein [Candidatus Bathyarchaeia archaeon]
MVSWVLRLGVLLSAAIIMLGLILAVATGNTDYPRGNISLEWVLKNSASFQPAALIFLGFLVLIATPVIRVAASIVTFYYSKDLTYTLITSIVLLTLIASFLIGVG